MNLFRRGITGALTAVSLSLGLVALSVAFTDARSTRDHGEEALLNRAPVPEFSGLRVDGNRLVNEAGQLVQLHGANRAGTEYKCVGGGIPAGGTVFDGPSDAASIEAMKSWLINAVRIPLNEDCWLGINGAPQGFSAATYQQAIKDYVDLLNQNGMYAILDLHWTAPGTTLADGQKPMPDLDHSPNFWSQVANTFKSNGAVIFELFNEPVPDGGRDSIAAWTCWRDGGNCGGLDYPVAGMQTLVDAVRATGATNVLALGGLHWANTLTGWLAFKPYDPLNQLVAALHVYNFSPCNNVPCYRLMIEPVARQVPVLATEIADETCDPAFLNPLLNWLDSIEQGYFAWLWNAGSWYDTTCAELTLIRDYSGTPTAWGEIYMAHLRRFGALQPRGMPA
jgi:endoglucanase